MTQDKSTIINVLIFCLFNRSYYEHFRDKPTEEKLRHDSKEQATTLNISKLHTANSLPEISFHSLDDGKRLPSFETEVGGQLQHCHSTSNGHLASLEDHSHQVTIEMLQHMVKQLQEQISRKESELKKLKEQLILTEAKNKDELSKTELHLKNLEGRNKELTERNDELYQRLKGAEEAKIESEIRAQKNLDEKREVRSLLEEKDRRLAELESKLQTKSKELLDLNEKLAMEQMEWKQHQRDLLTTVCVADEFKQEALDKLKKVQSERQELEEKCLQLEAEINKLKSGTKIIYYRNGMSTDNTGGGNSGSNSSVTSNTNTTSSSNSVASASSSAGSNNVVDGVSTTTTGPKSPFATKGLSKAAATTANSSNTSPSNSSVLRSRIEQMMSSTGNSNSTASSRVLARANSSQLSVRSLIESIEQQASPSSPTSCSGGVVVGTGSPLCSRANSVPLTSGGAEELLQRHLRQQAIAESAAGANGPTKVNGTNNGNVGGNGGNANNNNGSALTSSGSSKSSSSSGGSDKSTLSEILHSKMDSKRGRSTFRYILWFYHINACSKTFY